MKGPFYLIVGAAGAAALIFTVGACLPDDPAPTVPQCTDEIADAGGICQGVPTWDQERQADEDLINSMPDITLVPCPEEDSRNCYWDATRQGNGIGTSFVNIDGTYYYPEAGDE
jgi:hypothetical protein